MADRGGKGSTVTIGPEGSWVTMPPETDGRGCPWCGAVRNGGHGGNCPNSARRYDEDGNVWQSS